MHADVLVNRLGIRRRNRRAAAAHPCIYIFVALIAAVSPGSAAGQDAAQPSYPDQIGSAELAERVRARSAPVILDVRSSREYAAGHISGAINIPYTELPTRLSELELDKSDEVVVYCLNGRRADLARRILVEAGYRGVRNLEGQIRAWQRKGYPTE